MYIYIYIYLFYLFIYLFIYLCIIYMVSRHNEKTRYMWCWYIYITFHGLCMRIFVSDTYILIVFLSARMMRNTTRGTTCSQSSHGRNQSTCGECSVARCLIVLSFLIVFSHSNSLQSFLVHVNVMVLYSLSFPSVARNWRGNVVEEQGGQWRSSGEWWESKYDGWYMYPHQLTLCKVWKQPCN